MIIQLTKGFTTEVDEDLFEYLSQWKWHYNDGYAERKENGKHIRMHKVVLKTSQMVDHISGDRLDNRKANLRLSNHSTNAMNMKVHSGKRYKGVSKHKANWRVQIVKNGRRVFEALTPKERWAAMIYDLNAPILFGEFTRPNFPTALVGICDLPARP